MNVISRVCLALMAGALVSVTVFAAALATDNGQIIRPLVLSGTPTALMIEWLAPVALVHRLFPDGGVSSAILLYEFSAWLQLSIVFGFVIYFVWQRRTRI